MIEQAGFVHVVDIIGVVSGQLLLQLQSALTHNDRISAVSFSMGDVLGDGVSFLDFVQPALGIMEVINAEVIAEFLCLFDQHLIVDDGVL